MISSFDESYYLSTKLQQLSGTKDEAGKPWTETSLRQAITDAGMTPESHYETHGRSEKLNPNAYFNEAEYLSAKLAQVNSVGEKDANGKAYTLETLVKAITDAGLTPAEHYATHGAFESNAKGEVINPSNAFDANAYYQAKLTQMIAKGEVLDGKPAADLTVADVIAAIKDSGLTPVTHYAQHGATEAGAQKVALVQTVPVEQRVSNDPARETVTHEIVPGNYNPPTVGAASDAAAAHPVAKPADVGGKAPVSVSPPVVAPEKPLPVPGETGYVKPPAGLTDTNDKPVIPPSTTEGTGSNAGFIVVDKETGTGTVIRPDGTEQGKVEVDVKPDGSVTPPKPEAPVVDGGGNNTNDKPVDDSGKPVEPVDPTPDPKPEPPAPTPETLTASVGADGVLTFGGDAKGDIAYTAAADAGDYTFTCNGKTATVKAADMEKVVSVVVKDGQILTITDITEFTTAAQGAAATLGVQGAVNISLLKADTSIAINGGTTNDSVTLKATATNEIDAKIVVNLGAGNDTLKLDAQTGSNVTFLTDSAFTGGDGTDTLILTGAWAGTALDGQAIKSSSTAAPLTDTMLVNFEKIDLSGVTAVTGDKDGFTFDLSAQVTETVGFTVIGSALDDKIIGRVGATDNLTGGEGNDTLIAGYGVVTATAAADAPVDTLIGGNGADFLVGGTGADKIYAGAESANGADTITLTTANATFLKAFHGANTTDTWLGTNAMDVVKAANILEGREGNDSLYASNAKDVFLFQTGGGDKGHDLELTFDQLGDDTITGFTVGVDKLMIMDQDSPDVTVGNDAVGNRDFSAGWTFADKTIKADTGTGTGTLTVDKIANLTFGWGTAKEEAATNVDLYVQTVEGNTIITIKASVLTDMTTTPPATPLAASDDLTITLVGVTGLDTTAEIASLFGGIVTTS